MFIGQFVADVEKPTGSMSSSKWRATPVTLQADAPNDCSEWDLDRAHGFGFLLNSAAKCKILRRIQARRLNAPLLIGPRERVLRRNRS